jgi:ribonuclease P protein component
MHAAPKAVQNSQSSFSAEFGTAYRLQRKDGFDRVIKAASIAEGSFKVSFVKNEKNNARLGIIASKKVIPHATDRNQLKRAIRETFRYHDAKYCRLDMVVMVRRPCKLNTISIADRLKSLFSLVENRCVES